MLILAGVLAIAVGLVLGLLGGGGSILTVPLLVYVAGMDAKQAITASLLVVGVTALAGLVAHARARAIQWRTGLVFGASGMLGAFVGGVLGAHLPSRPLLAGFAVMMLAAATAMLRGRRGETHRPHRARRSPPSVRLVRPRHGRRGPHPAAPRRCALGRPWHARPGVARGPLLPRGQGQVPAA